MRKNWKKGIAGVLSVCLFATCVPGISEVGRFVTTKQTVQAATKNTVSGTTGNATWKYNKKTKTLTISGSGKMGNYDYDVCEIADEEERLAQNPWNDYRKEIKKVIIGDKITNVGGCAFEGCTSLTEVKLGKKVTTIDPSAFYECTALKTINFTDKLKHIYEFAFSGCTSLAKIYVGKELKTIDDFAFSRGCNKLKQIKVHPKNKYYSLQGKNLMNKKKTRWILSCFGASTTCQIYAGTTSLNDVMLVNSRIQNFKVSSKNKKFSSENGLLYSKDKKKLYMCPTGKKGTAVISDKATTLSSYDSLYGAFADCSKLEKIVIGKNINNLETGLYVGGCKNLKEITVASGSKYYMSENDAIFTKNKKKLVACISVENGTYTVPAGVEEIDENAFNICGTVENLVFSDSIIDGEHWYAKNITLGESYYNEGDVSWISNEHSSVKNVTVSEKNPYYSSVDGVVYNKEQTKLLACPAGKTSCDMVDTVTTIDASAWCDKLKELFVSDSVTDISQWTLHEVEKLHLGKKVEKIPDLGEKGIQQITVPPENETFAEKEDMLYRKAEKRLIWCSPCKAGVATVASGTAIIDKWVFWDTYLTEIVIPDSVTIIESIGYPENLERFTVDSANKNYKTEDGILYDKKLKSLVRCPMKKNGIVTVASGTAVIEKTAFAYCDKITEVIFPETIRKFGSSAVWLMNDNVVFRVPVGMKEYFDTLLSDDDTGFVNSTMRIKEIGE